LGQFSARPLKPRFSILDCTSWQSSKTRSPRS